MKGNTKLSCSCFNAKVEPSLKSEHAVQISMKVLEIFNNYFNHIFNDELRIKILIGNGIVIHCWMLPWIKCYNEKLALCCENDEQLKDSKQK